MSTQDFLNSPLFIAILSVVFTIIGGLLKMLWSALGKADDRLKALEISTNDLAGVKQSIAGIGERTGQLESESLVCSSNHNQVSTMIAEMRKDAKDTAAIMVEMMNKINDIATKLAVLTERSSHDKT